MTDQPHDIGEALSDAIWDAACFTVTKTDYSKAEFVAIVAWAASEAFDAQMDSAAVEERLLS